MLKQNTKRKTDEWNSNLLNISITCKCATDKYRLQHYLEWVMQVYTSKLTPDSVVTYLFQDCERSRDCSA